MQVRDCLKLGKDMKKRSRPKIYVFETNFAGGKSHHGKYYHEKKSCSLDMTVFMEVA
jgi:hypothetical protein